jgi:uncharacterized membrane protein
VILPSDKFRLAAFAVAGAIYLGLGYLASSSTHPPLAAVLVTAIPVVAGFIAACWRTRLRLPAIGACAIGLLALAQHVDFLLSHAAWLYFLQHVGAMTSLGIMFGSTLRTREGALCSRIAKLAIATPLDTDYLRYTWKVTLAWTIYFAVSAMVSVGLFAFGTLAAWSLFAAVVTPISLPVMFGAEYAMRLRELPDRPHFSIAQTIESYQKYVHHRSCTE